MPFPLPNSYTGNKTGGGGGMTTEERLARVEVKVDNIEEDIREIKTDVKSLSVKVDSNFRWLIGTMIGFGMGILAVMAHGFKWL